MTLYKVRYSSIDFSDAYRWCKDNCSDKFYPGIDWHNYVFGEKNYMIQFENEQDAIMFSLLWT